MGSKCWGCPVLGHHCCILFLLTLPHYYPAGRFSVVSYDNCAGGSEPLAELEVPLVSPLSPLQEPALCL